MKLSVKVLYVQQNWGWSRIVTFKLLPLLLLLKQVRRNFKPNDTPLEKPANPAKE